MAAEVIVIVEDEDARRGAGGATIEPGGREPADAGADHDQVVTLGDRKALEGKTPAFARLRVRHLERAGMLAAQAGERRRIAPRLRGDLRRRGQPRRDGERHAIEKVAAGDVVALQFCLYVLTGASGRQLTIASITKKPIT